MKILIIYVLDDYVDEGYDDDDDDHVEGGHYVDEGYDDDHHHHHVEGGLGRTGGSRVIALGDGSRGTATPLTPTKK